MKLPVNEIFETIQGEAKFTGTPAVFLRLQGCGVGCAWCDTKHTWDVFAHDEVSLAEMLDKRGDSRAYARMDIDEVVDLLTSGRFSAKHIVITGGEPAQYDLRPLTTALRERGLSAQLETSGTSAILIDDSAFVTVSPKVGMAGGKTVLRSALMRADEIKMPVGRSRDIEALELLLAMTPERAPTVWLQPISQSEKATALCVSTAIARNWRVSVQTHKYLGVR